jgi:cellulose synthase/poly-beta-1,6-N-acetylglucosamine synthase-like glycosyltransferase
MPDLVPFGISALLAFFVLLPVVWAWRLSLRYPPRPKAPAADAELPSAGVVLCLRGADPSLQRCLAGLLRQDYLQYAVWIVVDSETDKLFLAKLLDGIHESSAPVHVSVLEDPRLTCSLKVSAELQAIEVLREQCSVVAFIDADVVPQPDWLRSLVQPLLDPNVGATTGVRWYAPRGDRWGTVVRYLWNAGAATQMYCFGIPWGGSLAFRIDALERANLLQHWQHCFCEDTSSAAGLRQAGLALRLVPEAIMINDETIDLKSVWTFMRRQLICSRLHHPSWPLLANLNLAHAAALAATLAGVLWCTAIGWWPWAVVGLTLLGVYVVGLLSAILWGEHHLRRLTRARGIVLPTFVRSWRAWLVLPLMQIVHTQSMLSALAARQVAWRGITYAIEGRGKIRMVQYHPYEESRETDPAQSLV